MTQPLWKYLLCLALLAALVQSARLAAAPVSQEKTAQTSAELAQQFNRLGRDYRIQIYNSFRMDRAEYDRRRAAWVRVREMWQTSGGQLETKQAIIRWLRAGIRNSATASRTPLPTLPVMDDTDTEDIVIQAPEFAPTDRPSPPVASRALQPPRTIQNFSPIRGTIPVAPRSRAADVSTPRLRLTRPNAPPDVSPEGTRPLNRTAKTLQPTAPIIAGEAPPSKLPVPKVARRVIVEPQVDQLPPRKLTEPALNRRAQLVEPSAQEDALLKTVLPSSRKTSDAVTPPSHLAGTDRLPLRSYRPAPATPIELPPLPPPPPEATEEHAQVNLIELAAHISGHNRGLTTLENRLLQSKQPPPRQLVKEVAEFENLMRRSETITLYLRLLTPEIRQTLPKLNAANTAVGLLESRIGETRAIVNRGSFPAVQEENQLEREIVDAVSRKFSELVRPAGQK